MHVRPGKEDRRYIAPGPGRRNCYLLVGEWIRFRQNQKTAHIRARSETGPGTDKCVSTTCTTTDTRSPLRAFATLPRWGKPKATTQTATTKDDEDDELQYQSKPLGQERVSPERGDDNDVNDHDDAVATFAVHLSGRHFFSRKVLLSKEVDVPRPCPARRSLVICTRCGASSSSTSSCTRRSQAGCCCC
jgi:hypothetical protein